MYSPGEESLVDELFESAGSTGDYERALAALRQSWPAMVAERGERVRALLDRVPAELWDGDPWLVGGYGASFRSTSSSTRSAALPYFAAAQAITTDDTPLPVRIGLHLHHSATLRSLGRLDEALQQAAAARELAEPDTTMPLAWRVRFRARIALQRGLVRYHLGDYDGAMADLRLADGLAPANLFRSEQVECFGGRALLEYWMGDFSKSLRFAQQARDASVDSGLLESPFGASALIAELLVAFERNDAATSDRLVLLVTAASPRSDWDPLGLYAQATIAFSAGRNPEGLELLRRCLQGYRRWRPWGAIAQVSEGLRAMLLVRLGEIETAWDILGSLLPTQHHASCPARFIGYLRLLNGDPAATLAALRDCEELGDAHSGRTLMDVLLLKAAANYELGNDASADAALDRALLLAAQGGGRMGFRLVPESMVQRMMERAAQRTQSPEVRGILGDVEGSVGHENPVGAPVLTDREREIVRALVREASVGAISDELFISVNTVKSHLKNIYRKLGVSSRTEAVRRARELGLQF